MQKLKNKKRLPLPLDLSFSLSFLSFSFSLFSLPRSPRSREQEHEADFIGVALCQKAGLGDGSAAIKVFKCFDALEAEAAGPFQVKAFSFLSTHPSPSERAQKVALQIRAGGLDAIAAARGGRR